jgi:hypothetical protein
MLSRSFTRLGSDEDIGTPIFRGDAVTAREAAAARRFFLMPILHEHRHSPARYEIFEKPPGYEDTPQSIAPLDDLAAAAQMAKLLHQTSSEQALLVGRVTDAVTCIARAREPEVSSRDFAEVGNLDVALRPLRWWERRKNLFPWIAVVGTDCPEIFRDPLFDLREWLGVGVSLRPVANLQFQRACKQPGERGTVAGTRPRLVLSTKSTIRNF